MKKKRNTAFWIAALCCMSAMLCGCTRKAADGLDELVLTEDASEAYEANAPAGVAAVQEAGAAEEQAIADAGISAAEAGGSAAQNMTEVSENSICYVYICGAVREPGVYRMEPDERIYAVIEQAGGLTEAACEDYVNQAKKVADGLKIWIPTVEEAEEKRSGAGGVSDENAGLTYPEDTHGSPAAGETHGSGLVNINTAGMEELCTLTGIGEAKARAILDYRSEHGSFAGKEDIMKVAGIKQSGYDKIKDQITVNQE